MTQRPGEVGVSEVGAGLGYGRCQACSGRASVTGWQDEVNQAVIEAARSGEICNLTGRPEHEREVPAELIYDLCTSAPDIHARGVRIRGAVVIDPLDFDETRLRVRLGLCDSVLSSLRLENASARSVELTGSMVAERPVYLLGASIEGRLFMDGAKLTGTDSDGTALAADGMRVTGGVFLDRGFEAGGAVRLGARGGKLLLLAVADAGGRLVDGAVEVVGVVLAGKGKWADGGYPDRHQPTHVSEVLDPGRDRRAD